MSLLKKHFLEYICLVLISAVIFIPRIVFGDVGVPPAKFNNPLSTTNFSDLLVNLIQWLLGLSAFLGLLALVWGSIMFIMAAGDDQKLQAAKGIIKWALFGIIIIAISFLLVQTLATILGVPVAP